MLGGDWVKQNYQFLETWSKRWSPDYWDELISFYCLYIHENWDKFSAIPDDEQRLRFTQSWFKNNTGWYNSDFNKSIRTNNLPENFEIVEEGEDALLEVYCESNREDIRDFMIDLNRKYSEWDVNRIMKIRAIYLEMDTADKVLYDLYFSQMLSMRQIASKLDLPLSAVFNLVTELKNRIKTKCGIQL
jgi:hypothetical protein